MFIFISNNALIQLIKFYFIDKNIQLNIFIIVFKKIIKI